MIMAKKIFVILFLSLGGVAFGLRPQSTPPRDRPRSVNQTQTKSKPPTVNILKRVNHFQEQTHTTPEITKIGYLICVYSEKVLTLHTNSGSLSEKRSDEP